MFLQYGFTAFNLIGDTYLHDIKVRIIQFVDVCCQSISLKYDTRSSWGGYNNQMHVLTINQLVINDQKEFMAQNDNAGLQVDLAYLMYHLQVLLTNSHFSNMDQTAIRIDGGCSSKAKQILITNCTFTLIRHNFVIAIYLNQ